MKTTPTPSKAEETTGGGGPDGKNKNEEGILVAIRMRPLNDRESQNTRVWKVLQKHSGVAQCTAEGKPVPGRQAGQNFFRYDRVFGERSTTGQVYSETSGEIVGGVCGGLNGTIFAYGQTSSGKTFTMQGSGSIEDGAAPASSLEGGGIVHMAARDIFGHIEKDPMRVFLVRVAFIEIYNEEVRDLLVTGGGKSTLTIREDKRRGVFVDSNETIVTSSENLLGVLFAGEKNRSVGSTAMNERSSRSHTIFRITVESRIREEEPAGGDGDGSDDSDGEDDGRGDGPGTEDGAVRISTLNLVDLAGSESVRHTGATGDRQKEGGKINQSLLTLSRVIEGLGKGAAHVNFRDSKLTRILQPSLSGNARMAVICCTTPSELYLEETRSTLKFAEGCKLVKTCAQVNEIMDDRSLIKKLQRELREARRGGPDKEAMEQMRALEEKAQVAEVANRKAEEDLKRMKDLILKGGVLPAGDASTAAAAAAPASSSLFVYNGADETMQLGSETITLGTSARGRKRRFSDGVINENDPADQLQFASPDRAGNVKLQQARTEVKPKKVKPTARLLPSDLKDDVDISLLREALSAKAAQADALKARLRDAQGRAQAAADKLKSEHGERELLRLAKEDLESQVALLASDKEYALSEQELIMEEKDSFISSSLEKIEVMLEERSQQAQAVAELQSLVESLRGQLGEAERNRTSQVDELKVQLSSSQEEAAAKVSELEGKVESSQGTICQMTGQISLLEGESAEKTKQLDEKESALTEAQSALTSLQESHEVEATSLRDRIASLEQESTRIAAEKDDALDEAMARVSSLQDQVATLQGAYETKDAELQETQSTIAKLNEDLSSSSARTTVLEEELVSAQSASAQAASLSDEALADARTRIETLADEKTAISNHADGLLVKVESLEKSNQAMTDLLSERESALAEAQSSIEALTRDASSQSSQLAMEAAGLRKSFESATEDAARLTKELDDATKLNVDLQTQITELQGSHKNFVASLEESSKSVAIATSEKNGAEEKLATLQSRYDELESSSAEEVEALKRQLANVEVASGRKDQQVEELSVNLAASSARVGELEPKVSALEDDLSSAHERVKEYSQKITDLESTVSDSNAKFDSMDTQLNEIQREYDASNETTRVLSKEKEELTMKLNAAEIAKAEANSRAEAAGDESARLSKEISSHMETVNQLTSEVESFKSQLGSVTTELGETVSKLDVALATVESTTNERDTANKRITELMSGNSNAEEVLETLQCERDELSRNLEGAKVKLMAAEAEATSLKNEKEKLRTQLDNSLAKDEAATSKAEEMQFQVQEFSEKIESLESQCEIAEQTVRQKTEEIMALNNAITAGNAEITNLQSQIRAVTTLNEDHQVTAKQLQNQVTDLEERNAQLAKDAEELGSELTNAQQDASKGHQALEKELEDCVLQLDNVSEENEAMKTKLTALEMSISEKSKEIESLSEQLSAHESTTPAPNQGDVDSLAREITDLKSLLSSANASVDEARSAAIASEKELEEKEMQLEQANHALAEQEEQLRLAQEKVLLAESSHANSPHADSEELLREMELLMEEKNDAESRLEQEINRRSETEANIKRTAEDERQQLIEEAEQKMESLREEIRQLKSDICRVESDCFDANSENTDMKDIISRLEAKASDSESMATSISDELKREQLDKKELQERLNQLEEDSELFKQQVFAAKDTFEAEAKARLDEAEGRYNEAEEQRDRVERELKRSKEMIENLTGDIEEYKAQLQRAHDLPNNDTEMGLSRAREQLAQTKLLCSQSEAECLSLRQELESAKDKIDRIKQYEHDKQQKFAAKARDAIETLKQRLAQAESKATSADANALQAEVDSLMQTISEKDERIKKLEKSKITKSQIQNIQKLKDERSQFMLEAKEYKQRLEELEAAKPSSRRSGLRERRDDASQHVEQLQDELKQCEIKLRKYVAHSERLEQDRNVVLEVISSCKNLPGDVVGNSIGEMVTSICDRLVSVEEECDALATSETKASEYLAELDSLRAKHSALECQIESQTENDSGLAESLEKSKSSLNRANDKIKQLTKDKELLKSMAESTKCSMNELQTEKRRQMQYLESENLQLGEELKKAKKELAETRVSLDAAQNGAFSGGDHTEDLQGLSSFFNSSTKRPSAIKSSCKSAMAPATKRVPLGSARRRLESPLANQDSENLLNKSQQALSSSALSPVATAKKKRPNPFSSIKKARKQMTNLARDSPTKQFVLGDTEPTADVTSECNQS